MTNLQRRRKRRTRWNIVKLGFKKYEFDNEMRSKQEFVE